VKWQIPKNSLFSILLRSPCWISFLLATVIGLGSFMALPTASRLVGLLAALPFVVIGCMAARRQMKEPSQATVVRTLDAVALMSWPQFSQAVEAAFARDGYVVTRIDVPGADFTVVRNHRLVLVSGKRWKAASIGIVPLRELQAQAERLEARESIYLTMGKLTEQARQYAEEHRIGILQDASLVKLLGKLPPQKAPA
jgi:restriction system protein